MLLPSGSFSIYYANIQNEFNQKQILKTFSKLSKLPTYDLKHARCNLFMSTCGWIPVCHMEIIFVNIWDNYVKI